MATVNRTLNLTPSPQGTAARRAQPAAPPSLLQCLVLSAEAERRQALEEAAAREAWEAIVCPDARHFFRESFRRAAPLTVVDLPSPHHDQYHEIKTAAEHSRQLGRSLLAICGQTSSPNRRHSAPEDLLRKPDYAFDGSPAF
ncbi:MAG: hypothetical protein KDA61_19840, partial [Planctomycetales bacterium]|nr:hypothetical protein [Planctomycetales bacterium]